MNKNAFNKKSTVKVKKTHTGKLPDSIGGFGSSKTGGGVIFKPENK